MNNNENIKGIALMATFLALGVSLIFLGNMFPFISIFKNGGVSALFISIAIYETNRKSALALYIATLILIGILIPVKFYIITYALMGGYNFLKDYLDSISNKYVKYLSKIATFFIGGAIIILSAKLFFIDIITFKAYTTIILFIGAIFVGMLYDIIIVQVAEWYKRAIKRDTSATANTRKDIDIKLSGEENGDEKR